METGNRVLLLMADAHVYTRIVTSGVVSRATSQLFQSPGIPNVH